MLLVKYAKNVILELLLILVQGWLVTHTHPVIFIYLLKGYLGDTLTRSCGIDVLGIERESVRAESALIKRHVCTISIDINESEECVDSINKLCESLG